MGRFLFAPVVCCLLLAGACKQEGGGAGIGSAPARVDPAPVPAASSAAGEPAPPPPPDLDIASLQKALECPADPKGGPCAILAGFSSCTPWTASVPSGDGRWIGRGHIVDGKKTSSQYTIMRLKRVPTQDVGPGQLPAKVGIAEILQEDGGAHAQAERAIRSFERHDVPPRGNAALEYLKNRTDWPDAYATRTAKGHVYLLSQGGGFICQGPKQQLYVVLLAAKRGQTGDGVYAEVWATSW